MQAASPADFHGFTDGCAQAAIPHEASKLAASRRSQAVCQVCQASVSACKPYYQRYKICSACRLANQLVRADGQVQRFCQQCGRFHHVSAFDGNKRSCRDRLARHNLRRRRQHVHSAIEAASRLPGSSVEAPWKLYGSSMEPQGPSTNGQSGSPAITGYPGDTSAYSTDSGRAALAAQGLRQLQHVRSAPTIPSLPGQAMSSFSELDAWDQSRLQVQAIQQHVQLEKIHRYSSMAAAAATGACPPLLQHINMEHRHPFSTMVETQLQGVGGECDDMRCNTRQPSAVLATVPSMLHHHHPNQHPQASLCHTRQANAAEQPNSLSSDLQNCFVLLNQQPSFASPNMLAACAQLVAKLQAVLNGIGSQSYPDAAGLMYLRAAQAAHAAAAAAAAAAAEAGARHTAPSWPLVPLMPMAQGVGEAAAEQYSRFTGAVSSTAAAGSFGHYGTQDHAPRGEAGGAMPALPRACITSAAAMTYEVPYAGSGGDAMSMMPPTYNTSAAAMMYAMPYGVAAPTGREYAPLAPAGTWGAGAAGAHILPQHGSEHSCNSQVLPQQDLPGDVLGLGGNQNLHAILENIMCWAG